MSKMDLWFAVQIAFVAAVVIVGVIMYLRYRKRLKEAISEKASSKKRLHGVSPLEFVPLLLMVLLVIWNGALLGRVSKLYGDVENQHSEMQERFGSIDGQLSDVKSTVEKCYDPYQSFSLEMTKVIEDGELTRLDVAVKLGDECADDAKVFLKAGKQREELKKDLTGVYKGSLVPQDDLVFKRDPFIEIEEGMHFHSIQLINFEWK